MKTELLQAIFFAVELLKKREDELQEPEFREEQSVLHPRSGISPPAHTIPMPAYVPLPQELEEYAEDLPPEERGPGRQEITPTQELELIPALEGATYYGGNPTIPQKNPPKVKKRRKTQDASARRRRSVSNRSIR